MCLCRFLNLDAAGSKRVLARYYKKMFLRVMLPGEIALQALGYYTNKIERSLNNEWMVSLRVRATHRSGWVVPQLNTGYLHHISLFQGEQWDCDAVAAKLGAWPLPTIQTTGQWNAYRRTYPKSAIRIQFGERLLWRLEVLRSSSTLVWFGTTGKGKKLHCSL